MSETKMTDRVEFVTVLAGIAGLGFDLCVLDHMSVPMLIAALGCVAFPIFRRSSSGDWTENAMMLTAHETPWQPPVELSDDDRVWLERQLALSGVEDPPAVVAGTKALTASSAQQINELRAKQRELGVTPDGIMGPSTRAAMQKRGERYITLPSQKPRVYRMNVPEEKPFQYDETNHVCDKISDGRCVMCGWDWKKVPVKTLREQHGDTHYWKWDARMQRNLCDCGVELGAPRAFQTGPYFDANGNWVVR